MDLFDIAAKISLNTSEYERNLSAAENKGSGFADKLKKGFGAAIKISAAAIGAGAAAISGFASSAVKTGVSFDASMSQIAATLGLTVDQINNNVDGAGDTFDALREKALEMGAATNFSAEQAADGLNILAMSGFDANQSMTMIEDVLHLAAAGSMDLASAAGYVSGAMKGFADDTKDAGYYADLMAKGATLANTSVQQLGDAMSSGAAGAAAYNQSADSMTVALLRLAEQGDVGAAAGTALSAAMKNLYTPTDQAKRALKKLGVAAYDETGAARDFNTVVDELAASLNGMSDKQANAYKQTIFGIQGLNAYNKMAVTSSEKTADWSEALARAGDGAGEAAKQYATMTDNLQGDIDILHSAFDGFKLAISDELTPTIRDFVKFGSDSFSRLTKAFREGGLGGAMNELGDIIRDGIGKITELLPTILSAGASLIGALVSGILQNLPSIADAALGIVMTLLDNITAPGNAENIIKTAFSIVSKLAISISQALPELIPAAISMVLQLIDALLSPEGIDLLIDGAIGLIMGLADGLISAIPLLIEKAPEIVIKFVEAIIRNAPKLWSAAVELIKKLVEGLRSAFNQLLIAGKELIEWIGNGIASLWPKVKAWGAEIIDKIWNGLKSGITNAYTWGKDMIDNFGKGITAKAQALLDKVKGIASKIKSYIGFSEPEDGPLSDFHTYAPDMMELFIKGIEDNKRRLERTVSDAFDFGGIISAGSGFENNSVIRPAVAGAVGGFNGQVNLYIDGDKLVGTTSQKMDRDLGNMQKLKARWEGEN